jgi:hypothetical protein
MRLSLAPAHFQQPKLMQFSFSARRLPKLRTTWRTEGMHSSEYNEGNCRRVGTTRTSQTDTSVPARIFIVRKCRQKRRCRSEPKTPELTWNHGIERSIYDFQAAYPTGPSRILISRRRCLISPFSVMCAFAVSFDSVQVSLSIGSRFPKPGSNSLQNWQSRPVRVSFG